jgi:predicted RNA binding protein YcfA (HicA-like mRNA interferase family)
MKSISGKHFCKILESNGWILKRINGSHFIYKKEGREDILVVPVHGKEDLKEGLLKSMMRQAGLKESDL